MSLFDITTGTNDLAHHGGACRYDYLCTAKKGYDVPTGLGTRWHRRLLLSARHIGQGRVGERSAAQLSRRPSQTKPTACTGRSGDDATSAAPDMPIKTGTPKP